MPKNIRQTKPSAILLLNDIDSSAEIKRIIEENGISVIVTNDPGEAIEQCRLSPPRLVVVDGLLKDMSGIKLLSDLLRISWTISSILIADQDEETIHNITEGLGILGHIRNYNDTEKLKELLKVFHSFENNL
jgi:DNA-binding NarL/FixJ family response regulator